MLARRTLTRGSRRDLPGSAALGRALSLAACAGGVAACIGNIGDPGASGGPGGPGDPDDPGYVASSTSLFACKPNLVAPELPLRRLSRTQYDNAVRDLVGALVPAEQDAVLAEVQAALADLPADAPTGPDPQFGAMHRLDQTIYQQTVEGTYAVGRAVGEAIVASSERLAAAAGACATDGDAANDDACVDDFIRGFGARALRRPVTDDDVALYRTVIDGPLEAADWVDVVTQLFSSPWLLYFVEPGEGDVEAGPVALGPYELASRLSFHFWQTIPDAELLAAASSGVLLDEDGYRAQVERLFQDPRTRSALGELAHDWLAPEYLPDLSAQVGSPAYDAFRGDFTPTSALRGEMVRELQDMVAYYAQDTDAGFDAFFASDRSFASSADVAAIYGVPVWEGGEPPAFAEPERVGLLGRAALTATGLATTRPIIKGVYARKVLLCDTLPPPPADAMMIAAAAEQLDPGATARQRAQSISEARSDCAGCHEKLINPLGFVTEGFDGLGRFRTVETVYDLDTGAVLAEAPVDSSAIPLVVSDDDRVAADSGTLSRYMLESEKPQACFARHYFRFTFGREEQDEEDGCTLEEMHAALLAGESMGSVLRTIALRPEFRRRTIEQ
jgi:hypothetical protein